jgi:hypothetical protein
MEVYQSFDIADGEISIQERVGNDSPYESVDICAKEVEGINLWVEATYNNEDEITGCSINLSVHHVENDEGKVFHSSLDARIDRVKLKQLCGFLSFILDNCVS